MATMTINKSELAGAIKTALGNYKTGLDARETIEEAASGLFPVLAIVGTDPVGAAIFGDLDERRVVIHDVPQQKREDVVNALLDLASAYQVSLA